MNREIMRKMIEKTMAGDSNSYTKAEAIMIYIKVWTEAKRQLRDGVYSISEYSNYNGSFDNFMNKEVFQGTDPLRFSEALVHIISTRKIEE